MPAPYAAYLLPSVAVAIGTFSAFVRRPLSSTVNLIAFTVSVPKGSLFPPRALTEVRDSVLKSPGTTVVVIRSIIGLPLTPSPLLTEILVVPTIVLHATLPGEILEINPVDCKIAIEFRSLEYGCADCPTTLPSRPYADKVVGFSASVILPLASTVTLV